VSRRPVALVTRAEPGASETAEALAGLGWQAVLEPLFTIEELAADPGEYDALAFTSANGARLFAARIARRDTPVFCVGGRTALEAGRLGFSDVSSADADVGGLAALIARRLPEGRRLLHVGNAETAGDLCGRLRTLGVNARFLANYRPQPRPAPGPALKALLAGSEGADAVLIHSAKAARILAGFIRSPIRAPVAAISEAAAAPLLGRTGRIEIAGAPNEGALLKALEKLRPARNPNPDNVLRPSHPRQDG